MWQASLIHSPMVHSSPSVLPGQAAGSQNGVHSSGGSGRGRSMQVSFSQRLMVQRFPVGGQSLSVRHSGVQASRIGRSTQFPASQRLIVQMLVVSGQSASVVHCGWQSGGGSGRGRSIQRVFSQTLWVQGLGVSGQSVSMVHPVGQEPLSMKRHWPVAGTQESLVQVSPSVQIVGVETH